MKEKKDRTSDECIMGVPARYYTLSYKNTFFNILINLQYIKHFSGNHNCDLSALMSHFRC